MSLNLEQKQTVVKEVSENISDASTAILAEYRGLTVAQMTELRTEARNQGVYLRVVKNSLTRRVVEGSSFECLKDHLVGPLALAASEDPVAVAKVLSNFSKDNDALQIKVGAMNGAVLTVEEITALSKLPSRDELLAKLLGTLNAPMQKFVSTLNEVPSKFVRLLAAVKDAKPAEAAASPEPAAAETETKAETEAEAPADAPEQASDSPAEKSEDKADDKAVEEGSTEEK